MEKEPDRWDYFKSWAEANGVDLEYEEDWRPWYDCWYAGFTEAMEIDDDVDERRSLEGD